MRKSKQTVLLFLTLAGALIALLAMGLPDLTLLPGQSFAFEMSETATTEINALISQGGTLFNIFRGLVAITALMLPVYVIYSLFSAKGRKRLIYNILMIIMIFALAEHLRTHPPEYSGDQQSQLNDAGDSGQFGEGEPPPVFSAEPPEWLTLAIVLAGSLIVAAVIIAIVWRLRGRLQLGASALEQLAEEAQIAITSLHAGDDFTSTILRCYREMSRVLEQEKGVTRGRTVTPREFETLLLDKGLPQDAIRTLTRLFEQVRYGHLSVGTQETDLAVSSLTTIVAACQTIGTVHE